MADVSAGFWAVVEIVDNGGDVTVRTFQMTAADAEAADADLLTIVAAIRGVSDGVVRSFYNYEKMRNDAFAYPASGVELQNQALMNFQLVTTGKTATATIPAPKPTIFVGSAGPTAENVDPADAAVIAYVDLFQADGQCLISDGEVVAGLISGKRIHRKSSNG
jgi:hypothetical protein